MKLHGPKVPSGVAIKRRAILGGLHHEYRLEQAAADPDQVFAHYTCCECESLTSNPDSG